MTDDDFTQLFMAIGILLCLVGVFFVWGIDKRNKINKRLARISGRKNISPKDGIEAFSLRRKQQNKSSIISKIMSKFPTQSKLKAKLEKAGLSMSSDVLITVSLVVMLVSGGVVIALGRPILAGLVAGIFFGLIIPNFILGYLGNRRIKKFMTIFPDAIDFIVRGLRSGLPVTESMNAVGREMAEPVGSIFASMGESVRLGVPFEKALQDMAKKLGSTEFNFFVTSIILQRETGGNLSEILNNLGAVLRSRAMMKLKIKALSSEARASAMIIGALPFLVAGALRVTAPDFMDPLFYTDNGHIYLGIIASFYLIGMGTMIKMSKFEI